MDTKKLFAELEQNFGLRKNHILILEVLTKDDYTADKLVKDTGIPMGRIYEFLNDLLEMKLIEKKQGYPTIYTVDKLEDRILNFLKRHSESSQAMEKKLLDLLESEKESEVISLITGRDQLAFETMRSTQESIETKSIVMRETLPSILYPLDEEKFIQYRGFFGKKRKTLFGTEVDRTRILMFRVTKEAYQKGRKFTYISDRKTLDFHMNLLRKRGDKILKEYLDLAIGQLKKYPNIKVYVSEDVLPMGIRICDKEKVLIRMTHFGTPLGIIIKNKQTAQFYDDFFEEAVSKSKSFKEYVKEI